MKLDRLVAMIMLLLERDRVGAAELAEQFGVTRRTVYRDIAAINGAGIPIVSYPGPGGGVGIMPSYKVEKRLFSTDDIAALLMGLGSVRSGLPGEAAGALAKVQGMISPHHRRELEFQAGQIKIDMTPWLDAASLPGTVETVRNAVEERRLLHFRYSDIKGQKSERTIEPMRLLLKGGWYVQGYCLERQDLRSFKLLRMSRLEVLEQPFSRREIPLERLDAHRMDGVPLSPCTLRIHEDIWDQIAARFGEGSLTPDGPDHFIAQVHLPMDALACRYLLGFGDKCVCIRPEEMRARLRNAARAILDRHRYSRQTKTTDSR